MGAGLTACGTPTAGRPGPRTCPPRCGSHGTWSTPPACWRSPPRRPSAGSGTETRSSSALQRERLSLRGAQARGQSEHPRGRVRSPCAPLPPAGGSCPSPGPGLCSDGHRVCQPRLCRGPSAQPCDSCGDCGRGPLDSVPGSRGLSPRQDIRGLCPGFKPLLLHTRARNSQPRAESALCTLLRGPTDTGRETVPNKCRGKHRSDWVTPPGPADSPLPRGEGRSWARPGGAGRTGEGSWHYSNETRQGSGQRLVGGDRQAVREDRAPGRTRGTGTSGRGLGTGDWPERWAKAECGGGAHREREA